MSAVSGDAGNLSGRVAVVTGAASGIGHAACRRLLAAGASVLAVDRADLGAVEVAAQDAGEAAGLRLDLAAEDAPAAVAAEAKRRFGACDILVNAAGVSPLAEVADISRAEWRRVIAVNLEAPFFLVQALLPLLSRSGRGRVVNLGSNTFGQILPGFAHYVASKGGVVGLTRGLAAELGRRGITVNTLSPGLTRTPLTLAQAELRGPEMFEIVRKKQAIQAALVPEDMLALLLMLVGDGGALITGQTIYCDGGIVPAG